MTITLQFDPERLDSYSDDHLVALWHANEASAAPYGDAQAETVGDSLAREMARRFVLKTAPSMWRRQALNYYRAEGLIVAGNKKGGAQ